MKKEKVFIFTKQHFVNKNGDEIIKYLGEINPRKLSKKNLIEIYYALYVGYGSDEHISQYCCGGKMFKKIECFCIKTKTWHIPYDPNSQCRKM